MLTVAKQECLNEKDISLCMLLDVGVQYPAEI